MEVTPRRVGRFAGFGLGLVVLGTGALWRVPPGKQHDPVSRKSGGSSWEDEASRFTGALALLRRSRPGVVAVPGERPNDVLGALFSGQGGVAKLGPVLSAIEDNVTPPENDPLWPEIVREMSSLWNVNTLDQGLDLMLIESRPRAQRAVIASIAEFANSDRAEAMRPAQRETAISRFIDQYPQALPAARPQMLAALRRLGAADAAEVLSGRGLDSDNTLAIHREQKSEIEIGVREAEAREREGQVVPPVPVPSPTVPEGDPLTATAALPQGHQP